MKKIIIFFLKLFGFRKNKKAEYKIGNVKYHNSLVDSLIPQFVEIGDNFISAPGSIILAHDASLLSHFGEYRVQKTIIGDNVFLGANSVVLPGVTINSGAIIGAGSVVTKDVEANSVVAGNPAKKISTVQEYREKCKQKNILVEAPKSFNKIFNDELLSKSDIEDFRTNVFKHYRKNEIY